MIKFLRTRFIEFFQADHGELSMTRLLCFLAFWPSSYKLILLDSKDVPDALMWYLGAFVAGYVGGKFADKKPDAQLNVKAEGDINVGAK